MLFRSVSQSRYASEAYLDSQNARGARGDGIQASVNTIDVDSGHTLKIGDVAYFWDTSSSSFVEREITNTTSTSITVDGSAVSVNDNVIISNNFRSQFFYSTENITVGQNIKMNIGNLVAEVPVNVIALSSADHDALS